MKTAEEKIKARIEDIAAEKSASPSDWRWIEGYMIEGYKIAMEEYRSQQNEELPGIHSVIESRIKHFENIHHTHEASELKQALSTIQRLIPPIMFQINGSNELASRDARIRELEEAVEQLLSRFVVENTWDKKAVIVANKALKKPTSPKNNP